MITDVKTTLPRGLGNKDIPALRARYGSNVFTKKKRYGLLIMLRHILAEPMFILLLFATGIYFLLGATAEATMMLAAITMIAGISLYEEARSENALKALRQYSTPLTTVIRDGREATIPSAELVPGDIILLHEGDLVPADATVVSANDLTANESIITGEAYPVTKNNTDAPLLFQGATIHSGACVAKITATGDETTLGKLGKHITDPVTEQTLLQKQTKVFVRQLATFGILGCIAIFAVNFIQTGDWASSLILGLTLAMAAIPEEIPVSFSSFMALGAYHMSRMGIIPRQPQIVENLGAANIVCFDKTGTLTENRMKVVTLYDARADKVYDMSGLPPALDSRLLFIAALASERQPFDHMEKAIMEAFDTNNAASRELPTLVHEYALEGTPPMMTHVYHWEDTTLAAGKGAIERIMRVCHTDPLTVDRISRLAEEMGKQGHRVLGVASATGNDHDMPSSQDAWNWELEGLVAFYDPPRLSAREVIAKIRDAGIRPMLLTGDHAATAAYIASQTGILFGHPVSGEEVMKMTPADLRLTVSQESLFVRMFPEAKRKVIEALKAGGGIVAMTGDGVNDGPAIKAANIGIAMGKKGTEIARQAADLIITDDNLAMIPTAIEQGRKIYSNLKKAIRYIISIHIPIILIAVSPLLLQWKYVNIFSPIHVIFLELIMGPTCSLFYQQEPVESNIMSLPPRKVTTSLFTTQEMIISIIQGLVISSSILLLYAIYMRDHDIAYTRTMVFITLIVSNIFLTFTNRSFTATLRETFRCRNSLTPYILIISLAFLIAIEAIPGIRNIFALSVLSVKDMLICLLTAGCAVAWFEVYKKLRAGH